MPIHEFKCKHCGKVFEHLCMRAEDKKQAPCPACGHTETEILLSAFSSRGSSGSGKGGADASSCGASGGFS